MSRINNSTQDVSSYWYHFASYWTVSYYLPEREGEVKSWINMHYQVNILATSLAHCTFTSRWGARLLHWPFCTRSRVRA